MSALPQGGHDDFQSEPIRGLPERPPKGEDILWQGEPLWWPLAKRVFHIRAAALYLGVLICWRAGTHLVRSGDPYAALLSLLSLLPFAAAGLGLLCLLAWLSSRMTVYTITNRRVVFRIGVALPITINVPFAVIRAADLRPHSDGSGDIVLSLCGNDRIAYTHLWPHARPWRLKNPEPMLRAIPDIQRVAGLLGTALRQAVPATVVSFPAASARKAANRAAA